MGKNKAMGYALSVSYFLILLPSVALGVAVTEQGEHLLGLDPSECLYNS